MRNKHRDSRVASGFTLVEIFVVIGIIAVLAAIIFVLLGRVREKGKQTNCISNLRRLSIAVTMYRDDWKAAKPIVGGGHRNALAALGVPSQPRFLVDGGYVRSYEIFFCPADERQGREDGPVEISCVWCAGAKDRVRPGHEKGVSWERYDEVGDHIAFTVDGHHLDSDFLDTNHPPESPMSTKLWIIGRLDGSVEVMESKHPAGGGGICSL